MMISKNKTNIISIALLALLFGFLAIADNFFGSYTVRILSLCAINIVLAIGMNIVYGFTGMFSLGHAGFMAIGAYVATLLTMSPQGKTANFFMVPIEPWLLNIQLPFFISLIIAGIVAAIFAILIGIPVLKLGDDYLGIATLGFAEIIRVVINNIPSITNGSMGIKNLPDVTNIYGIFIIAIFSVFFTVRLSENSYGRALKAIRENEIAAEASGISLLKHKVLAFAIGAFFAGVGGALLAFWSNTIDPKMFTITATFSILTYVVAGGLGNITGTVVLAFSFTILMEWMRFIEGPMDFGFITVNGVPGMRMLLFSIMLLIIILRFGKGLFGEHEFSINGSIRFFRELPNKIKNKSKKGGSKNG
jgi:branched-chain amino acid transport system permease protein